MAKPTPGARQVGPCPLKPGSVHPRHLIWRHETGWVTAYGTPRIWSLIAAGLPRWHFAADCITRWHRNPDDPHDRGGWISPALRVNAPLELPTGETVCDICYTDLTGGRP